MENEKISKELVNAVVKKQKLKAQREHASRVFDYCEKRLTSKVDEESLEVEIATLELSLFEELLYRYQEIFIDNFDLIPENTKLHSEFHNFIAKYKDEQ